jgi:hypothetical protein
MRHFHAACSLMSGPIGISRSRNTSADASSVQTTFAGRIGTLWIKQDQPEACVAALEQSFREWHHDFNEDYLEQIREAVFGGKA